jgi:hypothetical protein
VILYLDRLRELGARGVTIPFAYPLYTPDFPGYEGYVTFYKEEAREVRKRGMKLDVETGVIFANTSFSEMSFSYRGLTFEKYKREKRQMVAAIIRDIAPDYLNLGAEPDTAAILTGMREYNDPEAFAGYVNFVLDGLDRGRKKSLPASAPGETSSMSGVLRPARAWTASPCTSTRSSGNRSTTCLP